MDIQPHTVKRPLIDAREYERVVEFVKHYRLELQNPMLVRQLSLLNVENPRALDGKIWECLKAQVAPYMRFHEEYPFLIAPKDEFSQGEYILGRQVGNGEWIKFRKRQFALHFLVMGPTDVGKTTVCQTLLLQGLARGVKVVSFDPKDDYQYLAVHDPDCLVIGPSAKLNILQKPEYLTLEEHIFLLIDCFKKAFYSAELTAQILWQSLTTVFQESDSPCLEDLQRHVDSLYRPRDTYSRQNAVQSSSAKIRRVQVCFKQAYQTHHGISFDELFNHSFCIPVKNLSTEVHKFLFILLVQHLFAYNRFHKVRDDVTHIIYTDEGYEIWTEDQTNIEGVPLLSSLQSMVREFSIGFLITTTNFSKLHSLTRSNTNCFICLNVVDPKDIDAIVHTFNLSKEQKQYLLERIIKGQFLAKFIGNWPHPILCQYEPLPFSKTVSTAEWAKAQERINQYAPPELPAHLETPPAKAPEPPKPAAQAITPPTPPLKLSPAEKRLLKVVCEELLTVTQAIEAAGLSAQSGMNAKKKLLALVLITQETLLVRPGRGNKGVVLFPTPAAYALLGLRPGKGTRGGDGPQHQYLVKALAKLIPECQVELMLGGKAIDLFFIYKEAFHLPFLEAINNLFHTENIFFVEGQAVALECEVSDPAKTGPENVRNNTTNGVGLTVVAVMPGKEALIAKALQGAPGAVVVDVLRLLQALREAYEPSGAS